MELKNTTDTTLGDLTDQVIIEIRARCNFDLSDWAGDLAEQVAELND